MSRCVRYNSGWVRDGQQFDERARQLNNMVLCSPSGRVTIARADLKAETAIKIDCGIEIAHRVNDMVEATGHRRRLHEQAPLDCGADERRKEWVRLKRSWF